MIRLNRFTLDNGLRVVHHPDASSAMVVVDIIYNVGARDESPEMTGVAHLFEHLMFGGSANVPDFDRAIERAGAVNNAWTSNDFTNFYDIIPAHNVETAFWVESDRMAALTLTPERLAVQQGVVIEEFKQQCLNRPYGDLGHHLRALNYERHPYRWPVIGSTPDHVASFTLEEAQRFYQSHYAPNNAVLVVGGNITLERCRSLAEKWFGPIPSRTIAPRGYLPEPLPAGPREAEVEARVPSVLVTLSWPMAAFGSDAYIASDLLTDLLAAGRSSRLYTDVMNTTDMLTAVDASILGSDEPGLLMVNARLRTNSRSDARRVIDMLAGAVKRLSEEPVSADELDRARNRSISTFTFENVSLAKRVSAIAIREVRALSQPNAPQYDINQVETRYRGITPQLILSTAQEIFDPQRMSTLIYGPQLS